MNDFKTEMVHRQPIDSKPGTKRHFGTYIKTSHAKKAFFFSITKKATMTQLKSLLAYTSSKIPAFRHLKVFLKHGSEYTQVTNISSFDELFEYLVILNRKKRRTEIKISW